MLWEQGDIDEKGWRDGEFEVHCDPLRSALTPLV